jgi:hypothetical protein
VDGLNAVDVVNCMNGSCLKCLKKWSPQPMLQNKRNLLPLVFGFVIAINLSFTQTTRHDQIVLCSVFSDGDDGSGGGLWTELRS